MRYIRQLTRLNYEHLTRNNVITTCVFGYAVLVILLSLMCGCGQKKGQRTFRGKSTPLIKGISKEELHDKLDNFEEYAMATVIQALGQAGELEIDYRLQKMILIQRTRLRHAFNTMLGQEEPVIAFIETWGLCVRWANYLKYDEGSVLFKQHQNAMIAASEKIKDEIERIGKTFLKEDVFNEMSKRIYGFAKTNPIKGTFSNTIVYATEVNPGETGLFEDVVSIPMAPFKAMTGVDRTASSIFSLSGSVENISAMIEELPESAKWQLLLFLMEMEETEVVKSFLTSTSKFSDSSVRLADSAEKLPEQLRQELSTLIQEIDDKQANLQVTLEKTEKTTIAIEQTLKQADKVVTSFQAIANDVNQAAVAWEEAATATDEALGTFRKLIPPRKKDAPKSTFKIKDYQDIAESVGKTVSEIRKLIESEQLPEYTSIPQKITNLLAWRLAQLIVLIFVLAVVYRLVIVRFVKK